MLSTLILTASLAVLPQISPHKDTDRVELKSGKELKGRVVYEDDTLVLLRQGKRKPKEIAVADTVRIESLERSLAEFVDRYDAADKGDAESLAAVARFAEERGLRGEALVSWVGVLFADPTYRPAYEALEARESTKKGWQFKIGKRWKTLEEAKARQGTWKEHWEVETTHFVIRTDLPVERVTRLAVNVERFYLDYYKLMHRALPLQVFDELPKVNLYVERDKMPKPPVPADAWYDWMRNELDVQVVDQLDLPLIMSEMSRLMLAGSLRGTIGQTGNAPPWCGRGLADLFGSSVEQKPDGALAFDFDREVQPFFKRVARAETLLPLKRLLGMSRAELLQGTNADLARAEAYTLVHFLIFGDGGARVKPFGAYLEHAYSRGQGSITHFQRILEIDDVAAFEAEWQAYARSKAGA